MNEGHSAFSALERIRILRAERDLSFDAAREFVVATNAFTTHTPVPAGNDMFSPELIHTYFHQYVHGLGIAFKVFLGFGRQNPLDETETFSMTVLALRLSSHANAVSRLHGKVARNMWYRVWPKNPVEDIPIYPITNGVHIPSWVSQDMAELFDRYVGANWIEDPDSGKIWSQAESIPDSELWKTHERRRERLVAFTRDRLHCDLARCGVSARDLRTAQRVLNPEILTIGFARRFAEYKRATLLLLNEERLIRLLTHPERPIQIIIAGKAHPHDNGGKELIRRIIHFANRPEIRHRFVFIQDYNIRVARMMLQGCDIWLNTPRRPLEACGTSGMKAVANGVLNVSTLDGWWDEGYDQRYGWAIGQGETYQDHLLQDEVESRELFDLLERDVVPLFYDRGSDNLPVGWIKKMKAALTGLCPTFNSHRMVQDYQNECYESIANRYADLAQEDMKGARQLAQWRQKIMTNWDQIMIHNVQVHDEIPIPVSEQITVTAEISLGKLQPGDVDVDLYFGPLTFEGKFTEKETVSMKSVGVGDNEQHQYEGKIPCGETGKYGFTIRIMPTRSQMETPYSTGLVIWASEAAFVRNP
jgi:starch phosphorylase